MTRLDLDAASAARLEGTAPFEARLADRDLTPVYKIPVRFELCLEDGDLAGALGAIFPDEDVEHILDHCDKHDILNLMRGIRAHVFGAKVTNDEEADEGEGAASR